MGALAIEVGVSEVFGHADEVVVVVGCALLLIHLLGGAEYMEVSERHDFLEHLLKAEQHERVATYEGDIVIDH